VIDCCILRAQTSSASCSTGAGSNTEIPKWVAIRSVLCGRTDTFGQTGEGEVRSLLLPDSFEASVAQHPKIAPLQRDLIYTGITRGKRLLVPVGQKKTLGIAVRNDRPQRRIPGSLPA